jgi:hypothetical protein
MSEVPKKVKCSRCGWTPKPNGDLDDTECVIIHYLRAHPEFVEWDTINTMIELEGGEKHG